MPWDKLVWLSVPHKSRTLMQDVELVIQQAGQRIDRTMSDPAKLRNLLNLLETLRFTDKALFPRYLGLIERMSTNLLKEDLTSRENVSEELYLLSKLMSSLGEQAK